MADLWRLLMTWLVWLSADPAALTAEAPKAAAAVAVAYAVLAPEPEKAPSPPKPVSPVSIQNCPNGNCPIQR